MSQKQPNRQADVVPFEGRSELSGRRSTLHLLERHLTMARQTGRKLGVFCIRIDHHADRHGESGEDTIEALRRRLNERLSSTVPVGWSWRDGLIVVHSSTEDAFGMYRHAKALLTDLERSLRCSEVGDNIKLSLGAALHPEDGTKPSTLLDHASAAAARASGWDDNGLCFSSPTTGREVAERLTTDVALCHALEGGTIDLRFQPVLDLGRSCMIGVRAEPVWCHPDRGEIHGEETLAAVERSNLSRACNAWLADDICRQSKEWFRRFPRQRFVFAVARSQLAEASLARCLSKALDAHEMTADLIDVAVDGKLLIDGTDHRFRTGLRQLADLGVRLTVANVGGELLSLEALKTLPLNTVEFAPDMISTIGRCPFSEKALTALTGFVGALDLRTRAVDVSSEEQLEFLNSVKCDEAVGPLFAPLMSAEDIGRMASFRPCLERAETPAKTPMHMH